MRTDETLARFIVEQAELASAYADDGALWSALRVLKETASAIEMHAQDKDRQIQKAINHGRMYGVTRP